MPDHSTIPKPARLAGGDWCRWLELCDRVSGPDYELTVEDLGPFLLLYRKLLRRGVPFAPSFVARVAELEAVAIGPDVGERGTRGPPEPGMSFQIDSQTYAVRIAARPMMHDGHACRALLSRNDRIIWLSDQLPRGKRRRELFHELRHAWADSRGLTLDEEADAESAAEMFDVLLPQYMQQGGDARLESMDPEPEAGIHAQPLGMVEVTCGYCDAPIACGSIATEPPVWSADVGGWVVCRGACCGVCDRVTVWSEVSTAEGMPTGAVLPWPAPCVLAGAAALRWVGRHAALCRVRIVGA